MTFMPKKESSNLNELVVNEGIFEDPLRMSQLIGFLSKHHQKLLKDKMYELYHARIILDYKEAEELRMAKEKVLRKNSTT